ncbi:MAG TPA: ABC transporter permease [Candidatus Nitrosotenuis sp.]|nr:ABC transporter permease [Candidatus Nitrosotenuis sp.]
MAVTSQPVSVAGRAVRAVRRRIFDWPWIYELFEAVDLALDAIRRNKLRSALTIGSIVIAVGTVIAVTSVINGLNSNVVGSINELGSNTIICYRFPWASLGRPPSEWFTRKELEAEWAEEISQLPNVDIAVPSLRIFRPEFGAGTSYVRRGDIRAKNVILQGNPPGIDRIFSIDLQSGRWFNETDLEHRSNVAVIGFDTAKTLFPEVNADPIGKEVLVEGQVFTVIGVAARQRQGLGSGANPEDNIAILPLTTLRKMFPQQKDYVIFIRAKSPEVVAQVVDSTRELLRRKRRLPSDKPDDFAIFTPDVFIDLWEQISTGIFLLIFLVASVTLLVGGIGVMNIMLVSVTERTREIGIRKAIGAKRRNIMQQFLLEAVTLTLVGGVIGTLGGAGLGLLVRALAPSLPASISVFWVTAGLLTAASIGLVFGSYPAWKAARLDPVDALRYE